MSNPAPLSSPVPGSVLGALITAAALADLLGVSTRTLADWRLDGRGPAFVRVGRAAFYRPEVVDAWLLAQEHHSTSEEVR